MEILALDVGAKKVGIARASMQARLPQPLKTVKTDEAIEQLRKIVKENPVAMVVVGLPRNLSGEDTQQTRWVRSWVTKVIAELGLPFYWQDEALTSVQATSNKQQATNNADEHSLAAVIILEDFLSTDNNDRVLV